MEVIWLAYKKVLKFESFVLNEYCWNGKSDNKHKLNLENRKSKQTLFVNY